MINTIIMNMVLLMGMLPLVILMILAVILI